MRFRIDIDCQDGLSSGTGHFGPRRTRKVVVPMMNFTAGSVADNAGIIVFVGTPVRLRAND